MLYTRGFKVPSRGSSAVRLVETELLPDEKTAGFLKKISYQIKKDGGLLVKLPPSF